MEREFDINYQYFIDIELKLSKRNHPDIDKEGDGILYS